MNLSSSVENQRGRSEIAEDVVLKDSGPVFLALYTHENRQKAVRRLARILKRAGFHKFDVIAHLLPPGIKKICLVCGWIHDSLFTRIETPVGNVNLRAGLLPEIVAAVHRAHEKGQNGLNTKGDELKIICQGYKNPCKAFDDLNHRQDYKILFYTRRRGLISLNGAVGINRNIA